MQTTNRATILIVDDTVDILKVVVELLKDEYTLKVADSPKKALTLIDSGIKLDLILLDIMMPDIDGFEVYRIIKQNSVYKDTPIIFLTALDNQTDMLKGFELGAVDYITKPFMPQVLKARVKTHIGLKLLQDELAKDLLQKEALLCKQSRMATLGEMFENIIHQWKQPLSVINMSCANIKFSYDNNDEANRELLETIDMIDESALYLIQTIDDFRDFARDSLEMEILNIKDLFEKTINILSFRLSKTDVNIINNIEPTQIRTYRNYLIQVMLNIINNSLDAFENSSTLKNITATSLIKDDILIVNICDSAGGIKMENINSIFDKYTTTKDKEDSGLGLYICKQIMQLRVGGDIKAYNIKDGVCMELSIPLLKQTEEIKDLE